jgi:hypothetical protein
MEFASGGLKGGERKSGNVGAKLATEGISIGEIGKIAMTRTADEGAG